MFNLRSALPKLKLAHRVAYLELSKQAAKEGRVKPSATRRGVALSFHRKKKKKGLRPPSLPTCLIAFAKFSAARVVYCCSSCPQPKKINIPPVHSPQRCARLSPRRTPAPPTDGLFNSGRRLVYGLTAHPLSTAPPVRTVRRRGSRVKPAGGHTNKTGEKKTSKNPR
jgi:hypothetical protein